MAVYTRPHKRKLIKRSRTRPVYGEGEDKDKYFRCWNCGWVCNVDRDELGDSDSSSGNEHTDYHETHHCSTYDVYKDGNEGALGPELLLNASFENSNPPDDWTAANSAGLDRHADPNSGTYCLEINENGDNNPGTYQYRDVETGKTYRFRFYVKQGTGTSWQGYVQDRQYGVNLCPVGYFGYATAAYVRHSFVFTIPSGCYSVSVILVHIATLGDGTTLYFDDISLRQIIPSPRPASGYATLGGDIGHYQVAQNIVTPDAVAKTVKHYYTSDISRGCPFCGSTNWRGDY